MNNTVSDKLKKIRKNHKLTQQKLADRLGVSTSVIADVESGKRLPSRVTAQKLADFFETPLEYWLSDETDLSNTLNSREKYTMLDHVLNKLIEEGHISDTNLSSKVEDLILDAVKIEIGFILMKAKSKEQK